MFITLFIITTVIFVIKHVLTFTLSNTISGMADHVDHPYLASFGLRGRDVPGDGFCLTSAVLLSASLAGAVQPPVSHGLRCRPWFEASR